MFFGKNTSFCFMDSPIAQSMYGFEDVWSSTIYFI